MGQNVNRIIVFIRTLIQDFIEKLKTELSPAEKNEVSYQLHAALQVLIFCLKAHTNETSELNTDVIAEIVAYCVELLDNSDLPMDTKNNCSMFIIMQSKPVSNVDYLNWLKDENCSHEKKLCIIFGIITTLDVPHINFNLLADVSTTLKEIFFKSSVDPTAMLYVCRSFMQVTKKISLMGPIIPTSPALEVTTSSALSIAFLNLEHNVDSIRHLSKDTLKNLAEISIKMNDEKLLNELFREINQVSTLNLKSIVVLALTTKLETSLILEKLPRFHMTLLLSVNYNKITNNNLINCFEALAIKGFNEIPFDDWFASFVQLAILEMTKHQPHTEERSTLESLLMRIIKIEKKVLGEILNHRENFDVGFILLCLSTGKKMGRFDNILSTTEHWKGIISFKEIKSAMINADDGVRTSALLLITESRKTTEAFTDQDFECIMFFLKYNINVQSPSMRQNILGIVKNLFVRIQAISQLATKKKESETIDFVFKHLVKLQEFCLENLFEGANYSRRLLSLRILFFVFEAITEHFKEKSADIWNQEKFGVLLSVLNDSYEANKEMAIEIMKFVPKEVVRNFIFVTMEELEAMVTSIKPPISLTAAYLMESIVKFSLNSEDFEDDKAEVEPETFLMLKWCEKLLIDGLNVAEKSLTVASSTNPLYGLIFSIRHLLSKVDLNSLSHCKVWREFFTRLIVLCKRLTEVVAPVVNNSSPEGIRPIEEFEGLDDATKDEWSKIVEQTTSQIILLCCWRTVKEVSLLLGDICVRIPLLKDEVGLVTVDEIISIGDQFLELLSKTKHRGAFEQCFNGFSQLCLRLWTCHEPELHKLPSEMLQQMIASISGQEKETNELSMKNLCATRRSAGLPYMIQALITSELKVSTNKNFHYVMKNLVTFCREGEYSETRTHSLNILRALFRCSDLNDAIGEYIADGIKCAILGYGAESWIERNSSTLLFSSLMVRIFGVQRNRDSDEVDMKNKMTGRIFFLRYPELYDFFMVQLQEAADYVKAVKMNSKLHPLLLLLIRLYPSALDGSESNLTLSGFIPVVSLCSGCVELQTRILCAKFIAIVIPQDLMITRVVDTIEILMDVDKIKANVAHGVLLQILHLIKHLPPATKQTAQSLMEILISILKISKRFRSQLICYATLQDILIETCEKLWSFDEFSSALIQHLNDFLDFDASSIFGLPIIARKMFLLKMMKFHFGDVSDFSIDMKSPSANLYALQSILNVMLLLLDFDYAINMQDEYEISSKEIFIAKNLATERRQGLSAQLKSNPGLKKMLQTLIERGGYYHSTIKFFDILSLIDYQKGDCSLERTLELIDTAMKKPEHYKKSLLKYANVIVMNENFLAEINFDFLVEISTDASYFVK